LFVGGLSERKGAHWLIDAFNECARSVPERAISVTIVGDGPLRTSLQTQSVAANLHVHWAGAVQYEELPRYYADAAALIFPSLGDEWGLVVNEALAAGVPVAGSSYAQAVEELILDNVHGWVFTPDGVHSISAVIERVLATPITEIAEMRVAARDQIRELTSENAARDIAQLLQTLTRS
jgi:hypothetical protein